ncbi:MAG: hypothetical protein Q8S04_03090 [Bacteroidales bacterium]|nr:hypothetical protein [Bacteroidales bacterium]
MAGFLFSLDSTESLIDSISKGIYSTRLSPPNNVWRIHHEGTFADYCSMKEGDNVYFFIDRKIYGIGILTNINGDCKFLNYPNANLPTVQNYHQIQEQLLLDTGDDTSINHRFICSFMPYPVFFRNGIDMDEILSSSPSSFKILRAFWKLSFIKFSDEENQAFKNILLRRNIDAFEYPSNHNTFQSEYLATHSIINSKTERNNNYSLSIAPFLTTIANENGSLKHEMAVEAAIIYQLTTNHNETINIFGKWDYLSHQVIASPFKPIDYIDKMDIFGYRYIENQKPTLSNYLVIEIKRGSINTQDILQLMKYVDWVKNEYSFGDYSMIKAFLVGYEFTNDALSDFAEIVERKYIFGVRPAVSATWNDVKLVTYSFNNQSNLLDFEIKSEING